MRQLWRRKTEVNMKTLSDDELDGLDQAKASEVRQYLRNEAVDTIFTQVELMGMRGSSSVKHLPQKKMKAKLGILGYQVADREDEPMSAATPTPTQMSEQCFLQMAALDNLELEQMEPCCWKLMEFEDDKTILKAIVLRQIESFLRAGKYDEHSWEHFKEDMKTRGKWSRWERNNLRMAKAPRGGDMTQLQDHTLCDGPESLRR